MAEGFSNEVYDQNILDVIRSRTLRSDICGKFSVSDVKFVRAGRSADEGYTCEIKITANETVEEPGEHNYDCVICHPPDNVRDYTKKAAYICQLSATHCTYTRSEAILAINAAKKSMLKARELSHCTKSHNAAKVYRGLAQIYEDYIKEATRKRKQLQKANEYAKLAVDEARAAVRRLRDSDPEFRIEACRKAGDVAIQKSNLASMTEFEALAVHQKCWKYLDPELIEEMPLTNERKKQVITSCIKTTSLIFGGFVVCVVLSNLAAREIHIPFVSLSLCYLPYYLPYQAYMRHRNELREAEEKKLKDAEEKEESEDNIRNYALRQEVILYNFRRHKVTLPSSESHVEEDNSEQSDTDS